MSYSKLPAWPFIAPDNVPSDYLKVGESIDQVRRITPTDTWHFYIHEQHMVITNKIWLDGRNGKPGKYATHQYEYPVAGARWFVNTVERFFLPPDHPGAVPRGEITIEEAVGDEILGVTRGAAYGGDFTPGYSFDNLNRYEHSTLQTRSRCQMFKMGDPWLFEDGLFDLFREIAERHERGEF